MASSGGEPQVSSKAAALQVGVILALEVSRLAKHADLPAKGVRWISMLWCGERKFRAGAPSRATL
jgi:hypothetical protein